MEDNSKPKVNLTSEQRRQLSSKRVEMQVSLFEAAIIRVIRGISYGTIQVHIIENVPNVLHKVDKGEMIDPTSDLDLLEKLANNG